MTAITRRRSRSGRTPSVVPNHLFLTALFVYAILPLTILAFNSVKSDLEVNSNPFGPPLKGLRFQNFAEAWDLGHYSDTMRNSLILVVGTIPGVLVVAGMAAYSLARLDLPGADLIMLYFIVGSTMPAQLFMVPLYFLWSKLGLGDSLLGLIVVYWGIMSSFPTFLLRSYMVGIPKDFEDAARVDGASELQVLRHVIAPITWPGFLTAALVVGLDVWNEFLFAVTFLHRPEVKPISTSLYAFLGRFARDWGKTNAAATIMVVPVIILFLLLQRQYIEGMTRGGIKG